MPRLLLALGLALGLSFLSGPQAQAGASWASTAPGSATARATTLAAPGTLTATCNPLLSASVQLDWGASSTPWADGYEVRWGAASGGPYPNSSGVVVGLTYSTSPLAAGTHHFVVHTTKGAWRSAPSNQVTKTIVSILGVGLVCT